MKNCLLSFVLLLGPASLFGAGDIKGIVKDQNTKEELIGATISLVATVGKGTVTGLHGSCILAGL